MTEITTEINPYRILNAYLRLADQGLVDPITCPDCGTRLVIWVPAHDVDLDDPALRCWPCMSDVYLSNMNMRDVLNAVKESGITL